MSRISKKELMQNIKYFTRHYGVLIKKNYVEMMRITVICIPTMDEGGLLSRISMHFGKTPYFTFMKLENGKIEEISVIESEYNGNSEVPVDLILSLNVEVVICKGLGEKASSMLRCNGVEVISGVSGRVKDVTYEWKTGVLQSADENICMDCGRKVEGMIR